MLEDIKFALNTRLEPFGAEAFIPAIDARCAADRSWGSQRAISNCLCGELGKRNRHAGAFQMHEYEAAA